MARNTLLQVRRDTAANWTTANPTLAGGEIGFETDTGKFKIGTGSTAWTSLAYSGTGYAAQAADTFLANNTGSSAAPVPITTAQAMALLSSGATAAFSMNSQRITSVLDPTSAQDAATKAYVDSLAQGLSVKPSVAGASVANLTLSGEQTIDGVTTSASRFLVKDQSAPAQNGIYVTGAGAWSRATDMDIAAEIPGAFVFVEGGTVNGGSGFVVASPGPFTVGSTSIVWTQFSGAGEITAGTGLAKSGNTISLSNPVAASLGGTGAASPTAHAVMVAEGSSAMVAVGPGTAGQVLTSGGASADPTYSGIDGGSA